MCHSINGTRTAFNITYRVSGVDGFQHSKAALTPVSGLFKNQLLPLQWQGEQRACATQVYISSGSSFTLHTVTCKHRLLLHTIFVGYLKTLTFLSWIDQLSIQPGSTPTMKLWYTIYTYIDDTLYSYRLERQMVHTLPSSTQPIKFFFIALNASEVINYIYLPNLKMLRVMRKQRILQFKYLVHSCAAHILSWKSAL